MDREQKIRDAFEAEGIKEISLEFSSEYSEPGHIVTDEVHRNSRGEKAHILVPVSVDPRYSAKVIVEMVKQAGIEL